MYLNRQRTKISRSALGNLIDDAFAPDPWLNAQDIEAQKKADAAKAGSAIDQIIGFFTGTSPSSDGGPVTLDVGEATVSDTSTIFVNVNGVCKATGKATLEAAKDFQRQINRAMSAIGASQRVGVDGEIGPETVTALRALAQGGVIGAPFYGAGSCGDMNTMLTMTAQLKAFADAKGVSSSVSSPAPARTPTFVSPATGKTVPQAASASVVDAFKNLSTIEKVSIVGALGGAAILIATTPKRRRR